MGRLRAGTDSPPEEIGVRAAPSGAPTFSFPSCPFGYSLQMQSSESGPTALDRYFRRVFGDDQPKGIGSGWAAGVSSLIAGALGFSGVLCLHFPQLLTAPVLRARYPVPLLRGVLEAVLIASVLLGLFSVARRRRKILGLTGIFLAISAMALGGAAVPLP